MTTTAWTHLPNATHIDRVLADVAKRPEAWEAAQDAAWDEALNAARDAAWDAALDAALDAARDVALDAAWDAARNAARNLTRSAVLALVAWDDAGLMLDQPVSVVRARAAAGDPAATLMLPAIVALTLTTTKE